MQVCNPFDLLTINYTCLSIPLFRLQIPLFSAEKWPQFRTEIESTDAIMECHAFSAIMAPLWHYQQLGLYLLRCKEGFTGTRCSECTEKELSYPKCQQCQCNPMGTLSGCNTCICKVCWSTNYRPFFLLAFLLPFLSLNFNFWDQFSFNRFA